MREPTSTTSQRQQEQGRHKRTPVPEPPRAIVQGVREPTSTTSQRQQGQQCAPARTLRLESKDKLGKVVNTKTPKGTDAEMRQRRLQCFAGAGNSSSGNRDYRIFETSIPSTSTSPSTNADRPGPPARGPSRVNVQGVRAPTPGPGPYPTQNSYLSAQSEPD